MTFLCITIFSRPFTAINSSTQMWLLLLLMWVLVCFLVQKSTWKRPTQYLLAHWSVACTHTKHKKHLKSRLKCERFLFPQILILLSVECGKSSLWMKNHLKNVKGIFIRTQFSTCRFVEFSRCDPQINRERGKKSSSLCMLKMLSYLERASLMRK